MSFPLVGNRDLACIVSSAEDQENLNEAFNGSIALLIIMIWRFVYPEFRQAGDQSTPKCLEQGGT